MRKLRADHVLNVECQPTISLTKQINEFQKFYIDSLFFASVNRNLSLLVYIWLFNMLLLFGKFILEKPTNNLELQFTYSIERTEKNLFLKLKQKKNFIRQQGRKCCKEVTQC
jgi:hypothetical protein